MKLFYTPGDAQIDYAERLGDPGEYPYTRGTRAPRARKPGEGHDVIVRELSGEGAPQRSNEQFHYLLEHGATGLDVIGDTPTQCFMDPDHPYARHAVGNQGVSVCRRDDYVALYEGIPLDRVSCDHSLPGGFAAAGLYRDKIDGKAGQKTRAALGLYEKAKGLTVDCWPDAEVLAKAKAEAAR